MASAVASKHVKLDEINNHGPGEEEDDVGMLSAGLPKRSDYGGTPAAASSVQQQTRRLHFVTVGRCSMNTSG